MLLTRIFGGSAQIKQYVQYLKAALLSLMGEEADEIARTLVAAHAGTAVGKRGTKAHVVVGELVGREVEVVHPKMLVGVGHVAVAAKQREMVGADGLLALRGELEHTVVLRGGGA